MTTESGSLRLGVPPLRLELRSKPELAVGLIAGFAAIRLLVHFIVVAITPYEIHRDEFLYLSMGEHLRFWSMDFPPLIAVMAKIARGLFGDTLFAVRLFPALAGTTIVILGGLLAREFGGGRVAQGITMLALCCGPLFLRPAALFQPVVWDQLWWTTGFLALAKLLNGGGRGSWILLGVAGGFGLLTKFSILFFAFGVLVALLLTSHRGLLKTRGPWLAVVIALMLGSPTIVGQLQLHLPVIIHMTDLQKEQLTRVTTFQFLSDQFWMIGPALLLAIIGLVFLMKTQFRVVGLACIVTFLLLLVLHGKAYYIGPIYPTLFAAGAAALNFMPQKARRPAKILTAGVIVLSGAITLPMGLPILPPEVMANYCRALGVTAAVTTNRGTVLPLPQDYADMLGWKQQVEAVATVYRTLGADKQARTGLVARNYGEAGALEFYGPRLGLPRKIMLPDNFLLWPSDPSCDIVVTIGIPPKDLEQFFGMVTVAAHFDEPWMVQEERDRVICIAERPSRDIKEAWKKRQGL